jgi:lipoprotein-releasing system permease protein
MAIMKTVHFLLNRFLSSSGGQKSQFKSSAFWGMVLVVTFVMVTLGVLDGYQKTYTESLLEFNAHVTLVPYEPHDPASDFWKETHATLKDLAEVQGFHFGGYRYHETLRPSPEGLKPIIFKGVSVAAVKNLYPTLAKQNPDWKTGFVLGASLKSDSKKEVTVLGGDWQNAKAGRLEFMKITPFGFFETGLEHFDEKFVLADFETLETTFGLKRARDGFEIRLKDLSQLDHVVNTLENELGDFWQVLPWTRLNFDLLQALALEKTVVFWVSVLVLLVAALNVFGLSFLFFLAKARELRKLVMLGLSSSQKRLLFLSLSLLVSVLAVGLALIMASGVLAYLQWGYGVPLDPSVYYMDRVPARLPLTWFMGFGVLTVVMALLSGGLASLVLKEDL